MAQIRIDNHHVDAEAMVFDKDGTLIDFHSLWGTRARAAVRAVVQAIGENPALERALYTTLGLDPDHGVTRGTGPIATVPLRKLDIIAATVLYQHGLLWDDAESAAVEHFGPALGAAPTIQDLSLRGDVRGTLRSLAEGGVRIGVATTDDRPATLTALRLLELDIYVELLLCGDEDTLPVKPQPEVLRHIAAQFETCTERLVMVGDTVSDLSMARAAGAGCVVGIVGGAGAREELRPLADVLIDSVDQIAVVGP